MLAPLVLACVAARDGRAPGGTALPNVVLILADDLGWGDVACNVPGSVGSKVATPHVDRLAAEGLRFTDAHSPSSVCSPTRYGILTGRYAWRGELQQSVVWQWGRPLLEPERTTLPELLREHGYATSAVGKWHLGWTWVDADDRPVNADVPFWPRNTDARRAAAERVDLSRPMRDGPTAHGFDRYFGDDVPNFPPRAFIEDDRLVGVAADELVPRPDGMFGVPGPSSPDWDLAGVMPALTDRAAAELHRFADEGEPFFLYLALTAPHTPIAPSPDFAGTTAAGAYGDFVAQVDATLGRLLAVLDERDLAEDTLVIFTSDNGSPARDGTGMSGPLHAVTERFGHVPNGPWRGLKADLWEAGHRVPLVLRWPARVEAATTTDALVGLQDLYATLAEALGAAPPAGNAEDSESFLAVLSDPAAAGRRELVHHSLDGSFALRSGPWKLIPGELGSGGFSSPKHDPPGPGEPGGQLYHLGLDPGEATNVWAEHPDEVAALAARLDALRASSLP